jgi:hypothetical protein
MTVEELAREVRSLKHRLDLAETRPSQIEGRFDFATSSFINIRSSPRSTIGWTAWKDVSRGSKDVLRSPRTSREGRRASREGRRASRSRRDGHSRFGGRGSRAAARHCRDDRQSLTPSARGGRRFARGSGRVTYGSTMCGERQNAGRGHRRSAPAAGDGACLAGFFARAGAMAWPPRQPGALTGARPW